MLNFKNISLVFILLCLAILVSHFAGQTSALWILPLGCLYILFLVYGSAYIGSNVFIPVICKSDSKLNTVALTFDDGPVEKNTKTVLDILKQNNIEAAFFCIGKQVESHKELTKRIHDEGHLVGNHSYSHHFFFDLFSSGQMQKELEDTKQAVYKVIHKKMKAFRPPYGVTTPALARTVRKGGYVTIGWSLRTMDTVANDKEKLLDKVNRIKPGDIILFHDTVDLTADSLQAFIDGAKARGYAFVRLDKLLNIEAYE